MKIVVLGAGVVGATSAYYLAARGHDVLVLDRAEGPGLETSFANGGQVSATGSAPWAGPGVPMQALKWLGRADAPLKWRPRLDPRQWKWLIAFLRRCNAASYKQGVVRNAALGRLSLDELATVREKLGLDYAQEKRGILKIIKSESDLREAEEKVPLLRAQGIRVRKVTADECAEIEPALRAALKRGEIRGGIHYEEDESGDAWLFTKAIAKAAEETGARFRYGTTVTALKHEGGRITAVEADGERIACDAVVLSLGHASVALAEPLGLDLPIYPVKGYSVTVPTSGANEAPLTSITDEERRIVVSRLGNRLRAAGMAEVAGDDLEIDPARAQAVLRALKDLFPNGGDMGEPEFWTGLRPMTPDGAPLLGAAPGWPNLFLNTGHGTYGWTMACGSARLTADLIDGAQPPVDPSPYGLSRFRH